jgi:NhaP-type Na+/H+ or K+/H+ antiporter
MEIAGSFTALGFNSIMLGIIVGLCCSYLLKSVRALTKTPVSECAMIFAFAYVSYVVAELCHVSGIIALLVCSIFQANYAWYNLSPQGKQSSVVIFQFLGFIAEGFVFAYIGLTFFSYKTYMWSSDLIIIEFVIILIGRGLGTFGLIGLLKLCGYEKEKKNAITLKELLFIWYAGLIRGAIAFGLVLRIESDVINRSVIVTTCLTLVVVSTIFFGSTVGVLGKCLFSKEAEAKEDEAEPVEESDDVSYDLSDEDKKKDLHQPLVHYNEEEQESSEDDHDDEMKGK